MQNALGMLYWPIGSAHLGQMRLAVFCRADIYNSISGVCKSTAATGADSPAIPIPRHNQADTRARHKCETADLQWKARQPNSACRIISLSARKSMRVHHQCRCGPSAGQQGRGGRGLQRGIYLGLLCQFAPDSSPGESGSAESQPSGHHPAAAPSPKCELEPSISRNISELHHVPGCTGVPGRCCQAIAFHPACLQSIRLL